MEVRPGYKQTEVGVIPEEWEVKPLGKLSELVTSGSRGWAKHYSDAGPLFVRSQNIRDGRLDFTDRQCVTPPARSEGSRTQLNRDDLLITITGNSVGNVAWVERELGEAYISQHVGLVRLSEPSLAEYVCLFLAPGSPGNRQIWTSQTGQSKPGLNLKNLRDFWVALPSPPERCAIATTLRDVDALLDTLERLIAKKRDLKQCAMQQLPTGKRRLPGFSGEWSVKMLSELGQISGAGVDKKILPGEPQVRLVNYMDVYRRNFIYSSDLDHVVTARPEQSDHCAVRRGDVFFTPSSEMPFDIAVSAVAMEDIPDAVYSYHLVRLRLDEDWDLLFRGYAFKSQEFLTRAARACEGSGIRYVITQREFRQLWVRFPPTKEEQAAIGVVLADIDAELAALEQRLAKTRALKQGMMQELLTGKTRLVSTGASHA